MCPPKSQTLLKESGLVFTVTTVYSELMVGLVNQHVQLCMLTSRGCYKVGLKVLYFQAYFVGLKANLQSILESTLVFVFILFFLQTWNMCVEFKTRLKKVFCLPCVPLGTL